jgi:outer membrane receptor protein involved in Fe transport
MKTISLLISLLIGINLYSQPGSSAPKLNAEKGSIKGIVKENTNKAALEYANVKIYSLPDSVMVTGSITSPEGVFEIKDIPLGKYYLVAEFIGYKALTISNLEITKDQKIIDCGEIVLEASIEQLDEAVVTGEKNMVMYQIDKKVVNIGKKITASGGNLVDALENTPSIQVDAEGNVTLRGSSNFTVLIDGKPTALSGSDALKQIPASGVENIEIITNPSAKFDPDGSAGILNIIMKKDYKNGMNGMLNASVGSHWQYNGDFNLNFRREKYNFFVGGSYADRRRYPDVEIFNVMTIKDTVITAIQKTAREQLNKPKSLKAGLDLYLSKNTTLTLSGDYGFWGMDMLAPTTTFESSNKYSDIFYTDYSNLIIGGDYINANFSLEQKLNDKGHKLLFGANYSNWDGSIESGNEHDTTDNQFVNVYSQDKYRTIQTNDENEFRGKIDYTYPINEKNTIEAGYQGRYKKVASGYSKENYLFASNFWNQDAQFDNTMDYTENIQSLYFTISGKLIGLDVKAGLRTEYSNRLLDVVASNENFKLEKFDLFPTLHISKKYGEKVQVQASYSRKINRPDEWDLYPVPIFSNANYKQLGNPELKPEYVDSYELNFMQYLKKGFYSIEGYYRQTNDPISEDISLDEGTRMVIVSSSNLEKNYAYGVELSGNLTFTKWFSVYASANVYSYTVSTRKGPIIDKRNSLNSDLVLNANFNISKSTRLQLTGFYNAPKVTSQGDQSEMYGVNTALRQEFLKKKLALTLRVNDVFQTMKFKFVADSETNSTNFTFKMDSPTVMFTVSYTLNNYKKRAGEEESEKEIGGGGLF